MLTRLRDLWSRSSLVRFLLSGGINTAFTYAVYLLLLHVLSYRVAYTASYIAGIALAFMLNRSFVFRTHRGWKSVVLFPFVYVAQYLLGLLVAIGWVETLQLPAEGAPLAAIAVTIPATFLLSRAVFGGSKGST